MSDYISREDALLCATGEYADDSFEDSIREIECKKIAKRLKELKPADVRENIKGEWIMINENGQNKRVCSHCNNEPLLINEDYPIFSLSDFCPYCGASMKQVRKEVKYERI